MLYQQTLSLPPATPKTSPIRETLIMSKGTVTKVEIIFPPGCAGLAHIQILHHESIIFPSSPDESFIGDTFPISWNEDFPVTESPFTFVIQGWNLDTRYAHSPVVRFEMLSNANSLQDYLAKLIGSVKL
jgi:hypothetical protein